MDSVKEKTEKPAEDENGGERRFRVTENRARLLSVFHEDNRRSLHPGTQQLEGWQWIFGIILRLIPAFTLIIGMYLFTDNAFGFQSNKALMLGLIALCVTVFTFARYSLPGKIVGILFGIAGAASPFVFCLVHWGMDPVTSFFSMVYGFFNSAVNYMMTIGYRTLYVFLVDYSTPDDAMCAQIAFAYLTFFVCLVTALCTAKRVHLFPVTLMLFVDLFVILEYNISFSKWGFAIMIAGIAGLLTLKGTDRLTRTDIPERDRRRAEKKAAKQKAKEAVAETQAEAEEEPEETESAAEVQPEPPTAEERRAARKTEHRGYAVNGISGAFATALILLILCIPAANVKKMWTSYRPFRAAVDATRDFVMAILTGEDMQLSDLGLTGAAEILEARSSIATPRYFTGEEVLEVQSNVNVPVYLRSWISTTYTNDKWYVASDDQRKEYKELFDEDFRAEQITYTFYRNLNPKYVRYNQRTSYANHEDDAYITTLLSIKNIGVSGNILFLPSRLDTSRSLLNYGTLDDTYAKRWINYFDGIAYSRAFRRGASYSAVAFLPLYKEEDWMQELNLKLWTYGQFMYECRYMDVEEAVEDTENTSGYYLPTLSEMAETYEELETDEDRAEFEEEIETAIAYDDYINSSDLYFSLTDDEELNEKLYQLALEIIFTDALPETGLTLSDAVLDTDYIPSVASYEEFVQTYDRSGSSATDVTTWIGQYYSTHIVTKILGYDTQESTVTQEDGTEVTVLEQVPITEEVYVMHAVEVRAGDNSYIRTDYYVDDLQYFLENILTPSGYSMLYHTAFAQRVAEYLANNMTYTLQPETTVTPVDEYADEDEEEEALTTNQKKAKEEEEKRLSAVEEFLFVTHEGYCVQYATSATLLLRSVGVPARYVEGYIVPKFSRNEDEDKTENYIAHVRDYNAHAWVEIYLPYYGWLTTEVTTPYYSDMYDPYEEYSYSYASTTTSSGITTVTEEEEEETVETEPTFWETYGDLVIRLSIIGGILLILVIAVVLYFRHQAEKRIRHAYLLHNAVRGIVPEDEQQKTTAELYRDMMKIVRTLGMKPVRGETPAGFAHRLDLRFRISAMQATEALKFIEKNEFDEGGIDKEELSALAMYLTALEDFIRGESNIFRRFQMKYLLGLME